MSEALLPSLAAWQNFYVIIGAAAATLTGLLFVVITLVSGALRRVSSPLSGVRVFNTPNVMHFGAALLLVAGILLPISAALALFIIAAAMLLLVIMGIRNAWDLVTYMLIEVPQSQNTSQH